MRTDAHLVLDWTQRLDVPLPTTAVTGDTIDRAVEAGYGGQNASALIKVLADDVGVDLARDA